MPRTSRKGCNSVGLGVFGRRADHALDPIPTVQEKEAERSRMETFLERSRIEERVERMVERDWGDGVGVRLTTRKVADFVSGASTCCGEMGTRWVEGENEGGILGRGWG